MANVCRNDRKPPRSFAARPLGLPLAARPFAARPNSWASLLSPDDVRRMTGTFRQRGNSSELIFVRHTKKICDLDDDVEKDGCVPSKVKRPASVKITNKRLTPSMVLTSLPSPQAKGECIILKDQGSVEAIEIISGDRYLEATTDDVDLPTNVTGISVYGKFEKQYPDKTGQDDEPFHLHNVCTQPNFVVMVLNEDNTGNLQSHTWDEIEQMQKQDKPIHSLISMWNTDQPITPGMTTSFFFNVKHSGESYNYYLEPSMSQSPTTNVKLIKVCVTGKSTDELAEENSRHLCFSIKTVANVSTDGACDVCTSKVDSHVDEKPSKLLAPEHPDSRPDSGLGSLGASSEES